MIFYLFFFFYLFVFCFGCCLTTDSVWEVKSGFFFSAFCQIFGVNYCFFMGKDWAIMICNIILKLCVLSIVYFWKSANYFSRLCSGLVGTGHIKWNMKRNEIKPTLFHRQNVTMLQATDYTVYYNAEIAIW